MTKWFFFFLLSVLVILPTQALPQGVIIEHISFSDTTKNQEFQIADLNSSYVALVVFEYPYEHWILQNGSLLYECFDSNALELVTLFVDKDHVFSEWSLAQLHWDQKCEYYNVQPDWYFGYMNNYTQIDNLEMRSHVVFYLLEQNKVIEYHEGDNLAEIWKKLTKHVDPTTVPMEVKNLIKESKKSTWEFILLLPFGLIVLIILRKCNAT